MASASRRRLLGLGAAAIILAPIGSAAAGSPARGSTRTLPGGHLPATEPALLDLVAGSPSYLVYAIGDQIAGGAHQTAPPPIDAASEHLFSRTKAGKTTDLGRAPRGLQPQLSLAGSMLVGFAQKPDFSGFRGDYWWNLKTGKSGRFAGPTAAPLSAAPHGAVVAHGDQLYEVTTKGKRHSLGTPSPSNTVVAGTASDTGLVVQTSPDQGLYSMLWSAPGHFTKLRTGSSPSLVCSTANRYAVGCLGEDPEGDFTDVALIPLNGQAPTTTSTNRPDEEQVALAGKTLFWGSSSGLQSFSLTDPKVRTGPKELSDSRRFMTISGTDAFAELHEMSRPNVSAYGRAVFVHDHGRKLAVVHSVNHTHTVVSAPQSPATVSAFALAPGRVRYIDDQRQHHGGARFSTYSAAISTSAHRVHLSAPRLVHADSDDYLVGGSRSVTVYSVHPKGHQVRSRIVVVYKGHRHTISGVRFDLSYLQVSGTRVLFSNQKNIQDAKSTVYNAATGISTTVDTDSSCCDPFEGTYIGTRPALAGHGVSFVKSNGSVWRLDLATHQMTQLSAPVSGSTSGAVFASGNYVGWSLKAHGAWHSAYRNVKTMAPAVSVGKRIIGMANTGAVLSSRNLTYTDGTFGFDAAYSLRTFAGRTIQLLPRQVVTVLPQVVGSTLAWVNASGRLKVRHIDR